MRIHPGFVGYVVAFLALGVMVVQIAIDFHTHTRKTR